MRKHTKLSGAPSGSELTSAGEVTPGDTLIHTEGADRGTSLRQRIFASTVSNYVGQLITLGVFFFLTPFIVNRLGTTAYGLWVLVGSLMAYGSLLDLGIWGALIKYVAEYRVRGEYAQANALIATALWLYVGLGLLLFTLAVALAPLFPRWFGVDAAQATTAQYLVMLMGLGAGLALPGIAPLAILRGMQRYDAVNFIEVIAMLITATITVLILLNGGGVLALVIANILGILVMFFPAVWLIHRLDQQLMVAWRGANRQYVRQVFAYSWPLFITDTATRLQTKTDEITIGAFLGISAVTPYSLAKKLSDITLILTKQLVKVFFPLASELYAQADRGRLRSLYLTGSHLTVVLSLPLSVTVSLLASRLLTSWVGATFAEADTVVILLSVAGFLASAQWPAVAVLRGINQHRPLAAIALTSGMLNLGLSVALIGRWQLVGVAWGTFIPTVLEFLVVFVYVLRMLDIAMGKAIMRIFVPVLMPLVSMGVVIYWLQRFWAEDSLIGLAVVGIAGLLTYFMCYMMVGLPASERRVFANLLQTSIRYVKL